MFDDDIQFPFIDIHVPYFNIEYIYYLVYQVVTGGGASRGDDATTASTTDQTGDPFFPSTEVVDSFFAQSTTAVKLYDFFVALLIILSLIIAVGIVYAIIRMSQVRRVVKTRDKDYEVSGKQPQRHQEWDEIVEKAASNDPDSWKTAVSDADTLLDMFIAEQGSKGSTYQERIESLGKKNRAAADAALDARNEYIRFVGEHSDAILTKPATLSLIERYKKALDLMKYF